MVLLKRKYKLQLTNKETVNISNKITVIRRIIKINEMKTSGVFFQRFGCRKTDHAKSKLIYQGRPNKQNISTILKTHKISQKTNYKFKFEAMTTFSNVLLKRCSFMAFQENSDFGVPYWHYDNFAFFQITNELQYRVQLLYLSGKKSIDVEK